MIKRNIPTGKNGRQQHITLKLLLVDLRLFVLVIFIALLCMGIMWALYHSATQSSSSSSPRPTQEDIRWKQKVEQVVQHSSTIDQVWNVLKGNGFVDMHNYSFKGVDEIVAMRWPDGVLEGADNIAYRAIFVRVRFLNGQKSSVAVHFGGGIL